MYLQCSGPGAIQGAATARCGAKAGRDGERSAITQRQGPQSAGALKRAGTDPDVLERGRREQQPLTKLPCPIFVMTCGSLGISLLLFSFYILTMIPSIFTSTFQPNAYSPLVHSTGPAINR